MKTLTGYNKRGYAKFKFYEVRGDNLLNLMLFAIHHFKVSLLKLIKIGCLMVPSSPRHNHPKSNSQNDLAPSVSS